MSEQLARRFHDLYEQFAPSHGYDTRKDTKVFDPYTANGRLMIAVCSEIDRGYQAQIRQVQNANIKLVGALDMIRESLHGGNVQDLLLIINRALDANENALCDVQTVKRASDSAAATQGEAK